MDENKLDNNIQKCSQELLRLMDGEGKDREELLPNQEEQRVQPLQDGGKSNGLELLPFQKAQQVQLYQNGGRNYGLELLPIQEANGGFLSLSDGVGNSGSQLFYHSADIFANVKPNNHQNLSPNVFTNYQCHVYPRGVPMFNSSGYKQPFSNLNFAYVPNRPVPLSPSPPLSCPLYQTMGNSVPTAINPEQMYYQRQIQQLKQQLQFQERQCFIYGKVQDAIRRQQQQQQHLNHTSLNQRYATLPPPSPSIGAADLSLIHLHNTEIAKNNHHRPSSKNPTSGNRKGNKSSKGSKQLESNPLSMANLYHVANDASAVGGVGVSTATSNPSIPLTSGNTTTNKSLSNEEIVTALNALGIGFESKNKDTRCDLLKKFHKVYAALTFIANERKLIKEILLPGQIIPKISYQLDTKDIQANFTYAYQSVLQELNFIEIWLLTTAKNEFNEQLMKISDILIKDFHKQMQRFTKFNCFSPTTYGDLLVLLKILYKYLRYLGINYIVLRRHLMDTREKSESRQIRRNIGH